MLWEPMGNDADGSERRVNERQKEDCGETRDSELVGEGGDGGIGSKRDFTLLLTTLWWPVVYII